MAQGSQSSWKGRSGFVIVFLSIPLVLAFIPGTGRLGRSVLNSFPKHQTGIFTAWVCNLCIVWCQGRTEIL